MQKFIFHIYLIHLICTLPSHAQFYQTGQDPASVKWKHIKTPNYRVIFDEQFEDKAQNIANILEHSSKFIDNTLQSDLKKFPVLIHSHSTYANGVVVLAPSRMELYSTPGQNIYSQSWLEQLVLHENRHVAQTSKMFQGITRAATYAGGEQIAGAVTGLIPLWFLEGDAVATETALSRAGRGRMPSFEMELRTLLLSREKPYSYYKAFYGSYKDYVPNHYQYGYQLVSYGRAHYGAELFNKTLDNVARRPFLIFPFYAGLKKHAGLSKNSLYHNTMESRDTAWQNQAEKNIPTVYQSLQKKSTSDYVNYRFPLQIDNGSVVVEKYGPGYYRQFVLIDPDKVEKKLFIPGFYDPVKLSTDGFTLVWAEQESDPRWQHRNYSVIKKLDFASRNITKLTHQSRYFAPDISPDGKKIVAVEITKDNNYFITILDATTGNIISRNLTAENRMPLFPVWDQTGSRIAVILLQDKGKSISLFAPDTKTWKEIKPPTFENITQLTWGEEHLYFRSSLSGIPNIHAVNTDNTQEYQVTSAPFGAYDPFISKSGNLIYANYSVDGFRVVKTRLDKDLWVPYKKIKNTSIKTYLPLVEEENNIIEPSDIPNNNYPVKNYNRWLHLFRFHSWSPFYFDYNELQITDPEIHPGVTLLSQNTLSTAFTTLGYAWKNNHHYLSTNFTYRGLYPVFEFSSTYGSRPQVINIPANEALNIENDGLTYSGRIYLPLNFRHNMLLTSFIPSYKYSYFNTHRFKENGDYYRGRSKNEFSTLFYSYLKLAQRDVAPRAGVLSNISYLATPGDDDFGNVFHAFGRLYIPGPFAHHSLILEGSAQRQNTEKYLVSGYASLPRGYTFAFSEKLTRFTAEYFFPFWYPDLAVWQIVYIKRFKARLFYDYGKGDFLTSTNRGIEIEENRFSSSGLELTMDFHAAQIIFPFNTGLRTTWIHETNSFTSEAIFSIDLGAF